MSIWEKTKAMIGLDLEEEQRTIAPAQQKAPIITFTVPKKRISCVQENIVAEIVIYEPRTYEDSLSISAQLKDGKPVIVNLKYLDALNGKRLIDFVCGTAYAFEGNMQKIGANIFLFTPASISICDMQRGNESVTGVSDEESNEENSYYSHMPFVKDDAMSDSYIDPKYAKQTDLFCQHKFG